MLAGLVPPACAFGLALVAPAGPLGDEVALAGDLEGQVGSEIVKAVRGEKHPESLMRLRTASRAWVKEMRLGSRPASSAAWVISVRIAW